MSTSRKRYQESVVDLRVEAEVARRYDVVNARIMILSIMRKYGLSLSDLDKEADPPKVPHTLPKTNSKD